MRHASIIVFVASLSALAGCSGEDKAERATTEPATVQAPPPPAAAREPEGPAPAVVQDAMFKLEAKGAPQYTADQAGKFQVVLEATGGYHVNEDYPIRVDVKAPEGVTLEKASLAKADAASFGEHSASFDVAFTAPKGEHEVSCVVDFAVCTDETCVPDQRTLGFKLSVM